MSYVLKVVIAKVGGKKNITTLLRSVKLIPLVDDEVPAEKE